MITAKEGTKSREGAGSVRRGQGFTLLGGRAGKDLTGKSRFEQSFKEMRNFCLFAFTPVHLHPVGEKEGYQGPRRGTGNRVWECVRAEE